MGLERISFTTAKVIRDIRFESEKFKLDFEISRPILTFEYEKFKSYFEISSPILTLFYSLIFTNFGVQYFENYCEIEVVGKTQILLSI